MDKIKALMVKCGLKPELADQICESVEAYVASRDSAREAEFNAKLEEAKRVCVDETEAHKLDLARRLQIFCEAKGISIEQSIAKQTAIKEAAALAKLRDIQGLLEGVAPNGEQNGDLRAEVEKLQRRLATVSEEKNRTVAAANRANAIAAKVLQRNRLLESKLATASRTVTSESKNKPQRLDSVRKGGHPQTTRATLVENQDRRPAKRVPTPVINEFSPDGIAASMDSDLI